MGGRGEKEKPMNNGVILKTNTEAKNCGYGRYIRHKKDAASNQVTPDRGIRRTDANKTSFRYNRQYESYAR